MKIETLNKVASGIVAFVVFIEVTVTIAVTAGLVYVLHHFLVKFW